MFSARELLRAGVPLTLLLDLAEPDGPDSAAIAREERAELATRRSLADLEALMARAAAGPATSSRSA